MLKSLQDLITFRIESDNHDNVQCNQLITAPFPLHTHKKNPLAESESDFRVIEKHNDCATSGPRKILQPKMIGHKTTTAIKSHKYQSILITVKHSV